jgi:hypothetical protein
MHSLFNISDKRKSIRVNGVLLMAGMIKKLLQSDAIKIMMAAGLKRYITVSPIRRLGARKNWQVKHKAEFPFVYIGAKDYYSGIYYGRTAQATLS